MKPRFVHNNITFIINDKPVKGYIKEYGRGGWKSDSLYIYGINGREYVPYQFNKMGIKLDIASSLRLLYNETLENLVYKRNPFLEFIKKDNL